MTRTATEVYVIRCIETGWTYVGITDTAARRWLRHKSDLRQGRHACRRLQADWDRYGEAAFEFEVVDQGDREQQWILVCMQGGKCYNVQVPGCISAVRDGGPVWLDSKRRRIVGFINAAKQWAEIREEALALMRPTRHILMVAVDRKSGRVVREEFTDVAPALAAALVRRRKGMDVRVLSLP